MNDVAAAFQCIFLFDTIHHRINIYAEDIIGNDTNIFVSYENLLKSTDVSYSIENIKTCLTVTGADELNLREVNMGYSSIYNLSYFHSLEYMSQQLYDEYNTWIKKWNNYTDTYKSLIAQYQQFYNKIRELESTKIPTTAGSTNWSEYGLNPLKEQLEIYQQKLTVMMKSGQGDSSHKDYKNKYLPCYNTIQSIQKDFHSISGIFSINCLFRYLLFQDLNYVSTYFKEMSKLGTHIGLIGYGEHYKQQHTNQTFSCVVFE